MSDALSPEVDIHLDHVVTAIAEGDGKRTPGGTFSGQAVRFPP